MKKFILPVALFTCLLFLVFPANSNAQSSDCWKEFSDVKPICDESVIQRNSCTDPDLNSPCYQKNQILVDKCEQANSALHSCLGLDKEPWKLESKNPGHLTCQEWKMLGIAGTAQNCVFPLTEISEKILWCLDSAAEVSQARGHQVDYILDFDPDKCFPITEDDLRQFKAGLPLTSESSSKVSQQTANGGAQQKTPSPFNIFGINPYETWLNIQGLLYLNSSFLIEDTEMFVLSTTGHKAAFERMEKDRAIREGERGTSKSDKEQSQAKRSEVSSQELKDLGVYASVDELLNRTPELTEEIVKKAQEEWNAMIENVDTGKSESPYRLDILEGKIQVKLPGQNEWSDLKQGDKIPSGSTIFTGMDATTVLSIQDKGVVQVLPFTEITITEKGLEQAAQDKKITTDIDLRTGEIELDVGKGAYGPSFQVFTTNGVAGVRGTHFWVNYNKDKRLSTVGVYRGEVEVQAKGSDQSTLVSPNGDKPGVVMVAQKLSVVKLILSGLGLTAVIFGAVFIIKRRGNKTVPPKKRK